MLERTAEGVVNWNRIRYSVWAPTYDALLHRLPAFDDARRLSIARLGLQAGQRVLMVGGGTGLDLPHIPQGVDITAIDITPAMLQRLTARAGALGRKVDAQVMDARALVFADAAFDAVVMHLILAVMPEPERGLREAARVLRSGGRIAVFDKFLEEGARASVVRRVVNVAARVLFSDLNRQLGPLVGATSLSVEQNSASVFGGRYRVVTLRKTLT